jgi:hypothetical protein
VAVGAAAGLAATIVLSLLMRITRRIREHPKKQSERDSRSPAASSAQKQSHENGSKDSESHPAAVTPAGALAQARGPGPEGAAEEFALKLSSGLFSRDISEHSKLAGQVVHYCYGTFWGAIFGLLHGSFHHSRGFMGPIFGLALWGFGPGFIVPRMKLMRPVSKEPPLRTALMVCGHIIYGVTLGSLCEIATSRK